MIAWGERLARVTSPLVGEVGSSALRASRERGIGCTESNRYPPPHPSPTRGEGAERGLLGAKFGREHRPAPAGRSGAARDRFLPGDSVRLRGDPLRADRAAAV